jgi:hypothetical protein
MVSPFDHASNSVVEVVGAAACAKWIKKKQQTAITDFSTVFTMHPSSSNF